MQGRRGLISEGKGRQLDLNSNFSSLFIYIINKIKINKNKRNNSIEKGGRGGTRDGGCQDPGIS